MVTKPIGNGGGGGGELALVDDRKAMEEMEEVAEESCASQLFIFVLEGILSHNFGAHQSGGHQSLSGTGHDSRGLWCHSSPTPGSADTCSVFEIGMERRGDRVCQYTYRMCRPRLGHEEHPDGHHEHWDSDEPDGASGPKDLPANADRPRAPEEAGMLATENPMNREGAKVFVNPMQPGSGFELE